jgi:hypothetical protein
VGILTRGLAGFALLALPVTGFAQASATKPPVSVKATSAKTEVTVGEAFELDVEAEGPPGTTYTFPAEASEESFELHTPPKGTKAAAPSPRPGTHRYLASVFALGEARVPPIPVRYRLPDGTTGEASTAPVALKVVSLLPKDPQQQKLADIRGPASVGVGRAFWVALACGLALVAALVYWAVRRRKRDAEPAAPPVPALPPDAEAQAALHALAARGLHARGEYRAFYIELTTVLKRYLERRLGAPVLEMTSAETVVFLRGHPHGGEVVPVVRDLAEAADRIKFARGEGLAAEAERHLDAVRGLVPALEARLRPAPEPAEGKAA